MNSKTTSLLSAGLLLLGVAFWGATFAFVKEAVQQIDPFSFLFFRFITAAVILFAISPRSITNIDKKVFFSTLPAGLILSVSFFLQTVGLQYTTASRAAFITGLCVIIVPVLACVIEKRFPSWKTIIVTFVAFAGLWIMTFEKGADIQHTGDKYVFLCAITFAAHLMIVGRRSTLGDPFQYAFCQFLCLGAISAVAAIIMRGNISFPSSPESWKGVLFCAIFASSYMYSIQAAFQKNLSENMVAMIYALEPLFAALFAMIYVGEKPPATVFFGGSLIIVAMVMTGNIQQTRSHHKKSAFIR